MIPWPHRGARATGATLAVVALALAGCSDSGVGTATSTTTGSGTPSTLVADPGLVPPLGFRVVTLVVTRADGSTEEYCLWVADTPDLRSRGLMHVTDPELGGRPGMVFRYDTDTSSGFWMRNTLLPLSIAYVAADGAVVSTADMEPCPPDADRCPSYPPAGPFRFAVEVPQGQLDDLGITADSRLSLGEAC